MITIDKRLELIQSELKRIPQLPEHVKDIRVDDNGRLAEVLDNIYELTDLNNTNVNDWN